MAKRNRKYFVTGLLVVLPIMITLYLFITLFSFFDNIFGRYISLFTVERFGLKIPGLGLLVFIIVIFLSGFFATNFLGRRLFVYFEGMWLKFPMVKKIYPSIKQITKFLFSPKFQEGLQRVVVVEYPRKGI